MIVHLDKNGIELHKGDWVWYPWWNENKKVYEYFYARIKRLDLNDEDTIYVHSTVNGSTSNWVEKLPDNEPDRTNFLFLKKLEN
jgi:hypothetical protein